MKEVQRDGFAFMQTFMQTVESLEQTDKELANKLLRAIIDYGIYREYDKGDPIVDAMMVSIMFTIDRAAERYDQAKAIGAKGGANKKYDESQILALKDQGWTHKQIADELGCSTKTIQRAIANHKSGQSGQTGTDIMSSNSFIF